MTGTQLLMLLCGVGGMGSGFWLAVFKDDKWLRLLGIYLTVFGIAVLSGVAKGVGGAA
jgi:hypothetical protein